MKKVIIKAGGYGYRPEPESSVQLIMKKDGPIELPDEEADRIIGLGIAEAYEEVSLENEQEVSDIEIAQDDSREDVLEKMTYAELKKMAKNMGLDARGKMPELIERIKAKQNQESVESEIEETEEEPPMLEAADPQ